MSIQLIDLNEDLKRLRDEAYDVSIVQNHLVIKNIPYVNRNKRVMRGAIFCPLSFVAGNKTENPVKDHTVYFMGDCPCDQYGNEHQSYIHSPRVFQLTPELISSFYFSTRPKNAFYPDYYHKMTRYVELLSAPAKSIDPTVSAQAASYVRYSDETDNIFAYPDTNSARAGIVNVSNKLVGLKIAIVGLGGTGSYVLDFVSKTPVKQISLFDGDEMKNHNAYRSPGIVTPEELGGRPSKVAHYKCRYGAFRSGIIAHDVFLDVKNVSLLGGHDFVFLCIDKPQSKKIIVDYLLAFKIPFVDLGMNVSMVGDSLRGALRKTYIRPGDEAYLKHIALEPQKDDEDLYSQNIQVAELNALNAILGIMAWKKHFGFYLTADLIHNTTYIIDEEELIHET